MKLRHPMGALIILAVLAGLCLNIFNSDNGGLADTYDITPDTESLYEGKTIMQSLSDINIISGGKDIAASISRLKSPANKLDILGALAAAGIGVLKIIGGTITLSANGTYPTSYSADAVRFVYVASANNLPIAIIDSVEPNPAGPGQLVTFTGHGTDIDGTIGGYEWSSNIDGFLSDAASFSSSSLSEGTHTVTFKVCDDDGEWSDVQDDG